MTGPSANELRVIPLFEGITTNVLEALGKQMTVRQHPPSQTIILQDDWGSSVYFVIDGWLKIRTYNIDGKEVTLNILGQGEVVGEMAALDESPALDRRDFSDQNQSCSIICRDICGIFGVRFQLWPSFGSIDVPPPAID